MSGKVATVQYSGPSPAILSVTWSCTLRFVSSSFSPPPPCKYFLNRRPQCQYAEQQPSLTQQLASEQKWAQLPENVQSPLFKIQSTKYRVALKCYSSLGYIPQYWYSPTSNHYVVTCFRALSRIGTAYLKQENLEMALKYFDKSLADHRNPDIVKKKIEVRTYQCLAVPLLVQTLLLFFVV